MKRFKHGTLVICWLLLAALSAEGAVLWAESGRHAFLLGDAAANQQLGTVLAGLYGFDVVDASGAASLEEIESAWLHLGERAEPGDDVLVFIGLPFITAPERYFVPEGADPESVWELLGADSVGRRLKKLEFRRALWVYASCERDLDLVSVTAGASFAGLDYLVVCDHRSREMVTGRLEPRTSSFVPVDWHAGRLAEILATVLENPDPKRPFFLSQDLAAAISGAGNGFDVRVETPYPTRGGGFELIPLAGIGEYREQFAEADTADLALKVLHGFGAAARSDPHMAQSFLAFLVEVLSEGSDVLPQLDPKETSRLRSVAVEFLGSWSEEDTRDALGEVAEHGADDVRWRAVNELTRRTLRASDFAVLRKAAEDPSPQVRAVAMSSLASAEDGASLPIFRSHAADDPDVDTRLAAIQGLAMGTREDAALLRELLRDGNPRVRREAANSLARRGLSIPAMAALQEALLAESDTGVKRAILTALGHTTPEEHRESLTRRLLSLLDDALTEGDEASAVEIISTIGRLGEPGAALRFRTLLDGGLSVSVEAAVVQALGRADPEGSVSELVAAASSPHAQVRLAAVTALGETDSDAALPVLLMSLDDEDTYVSTVAERALERLSPSTDRLRLALTELSCPEPGGTRALPCRRARAYVYQRAGGSEQTTDERTKYWLAELGNESYRLRESAVKFLAESDDSAVVERLAEVLDSGDVLARQAAARALGRRPEPDSDVMPILLRAADDRNSAIRVAAIEALGHRESETAFDRILAATRDASADVRRAAAEALAGADREEAREALEVMAKEDDSRFVRDAAVGELSGRRPL